MANETNPDMRDLSPDDDARIAQFVDMTESERSGFLAKHPELAREMIACGIAHSMREETAGVEASPAMSRMLQAALAVALERTNRRATLKSLAKNAGISMRRVAELMQVPEGFLLQIHRRYISYASIPQRFLDELSDVLSCTEMALANALRGEPRIAATAMFLAESAPSAAESVDFWDAVALETDISTETASRWRESPR